MMLAKEDDGVYILTELRLCSLCCRMFNRNMVKHIIGTKGGGFVLFQHLVCPPQKPTPIKLERGIR